MHFLRSFIIACYYTEICYYFDYLEMVMVCECFLSSIIMVEESMWTLWITLVFCTVVKSKFLHDKMTNKIYSVKCVSCIQAFVSGGIYAVPCQWPVYYGRSGIQLPFYNWWTWLCYTGSNKQAINSTTQPNTLTVGGICLHPCFILHVSSFHAHETPVSAAVVLPFCCSP